MDRVYVESSNIASIGYDPATSTLEIEFRNGNIYQYFGVPQFEYENLMSAGSKGSYLNQNIKKAGYPYTKVG